MRGLIGAIVSASALLGASAASGVVCVQEGDLIKMDNGFVHVEIDSKLPRITRFSGDVTGKDAAAWPSLLPGSRAGASSTYGVGAGIAVEVQLGGDRNTRQSTGRNPDGQPVGVSVNDKGDLCEVTLSGIRDAVVGRSAADTPAPVTSSTWLLQLKRGSPALDFTSTTTVVNPTGSSGSVSLASLRLGMYFSPRLNTVHFSDGPKSMANQEGAPWMVTKSAPAPRGWCIGGTGGVEWQDLGASASDHATIMYSGRWNGARCGVGFLYAGNFVDGQWTSDGWSVDQQSALVGPPAVDVANGTTFSTRVVLGPSQYDLPPLSAFPATAPTAEHIDDARAVATGAWASPMASMVSHDHAPEGRITPCVPHPGGCYDGTYNYFDPDSFLSVASLTLTFDPIVLEETRKLIDTNRGLICPAAGIKGLCLPNQVPHHLVDSCGASDQCAKRPNRMFDNRTDSVTYLALSGATQTGPNLFWSLAALRYAAFSGNSTWFQSAIVDIRRAVSFLLEMVDPDVGLLNAPGSLYIDTMKRSGFTSDSNAGFVMLLKQMADAEAALGNSTGQAFYSSLAASVSEAMNTHLWAPPHLNGGNHFVTAMDPKTGNLSDHFDYDANLLAVHAGVADSDRAVAILAAIDNTTTNACAHSRPTFVGLIPYTAKECFGGNTGDSAVSMGRIAWSDGHARLAVPLGNAQVDRVESFRSLIMDPLQEELLANTWMYERYQCGGQGTHNAWYIEYGEVAGMLVGEVKHGIAIGLSTIKIDPIDPSEELELAVGQSLFHRSPERVSVALPLFDGSKRAFEVHGMQPGNYSVVNAFVDESPSRPLQRLVQAVSQRSFLAGASVWAPPPKFSVSFSGWQVEVGSDGVLRFTAAIGGSVAVSAQRM